VTIGIVARETTTTVIGVETTTGIVTTMIGIGGTIVIVISVGIGDLTPVRVQGVPMIGRGASVMTIGDTETPVVLLTRGGPIARAVADMIEYPSE